VRTVQLGAPRDRSGRAEAGQLCSLFRDAGVEVTVVFCGFDGNDYSTLEAVAATVGLTPPKLRAGRLAETREMAEFAAALGCPAIGMHLGVLPPVTAGTDYAAIVAVVRDVCDHCARLGQRLHLETGQESAAELLALIRRVERANLAVNFDPANMILYGSDDPIAALDALGPLVKSVHCKDATRRRRPGQPWYEDCPLGSGDVDFPRFLRTLRTIGYTGPLTIEREYSPDQEADLAAAVRYLERLKAEFADVPQSPPARRSN
jgi:sugar phosphate isomerase/epimerase